MSTEPEYILENKFIAQLTGLGYQLTYVNNVGLLKDNLREELERLNDCKLSDSEWYKVQTQLTKGSKSIDRARLLREQLIIERDGQPALRLKLADQRNWKNNSFQVLNQFHNQNGNIKTRYDVTLLMNGLPVVQIELKRRGNEIKEAFNQVQGYQRDTYHAGEGYFQFIQMFVITNGVNTEYFANNSRLNKLFSFNWTDEDNNAINQLTDFTNTFLNREHLHKMIFRYTVLTTENVAMMLRPYQCYAVEGILKTVEEGSGNGYVWHTTGSGKTLTSFKASQILTQRSDIKKVVFVVDRKDLDTQTVQEFANFSDDSFEDTDKTATLVKQLKNDAVPLIVTTIQKLNKAVSSLEREISHLKDEKIVFIFDECHRSQFGATHKRITEFFTNTQLFGFTGTPIFAENSSNNEHGKRTTTDLFDTCLHKYLIVDAIEDRNVLPFKIDYVGKYEDKTNSNTFVEMEVQGIDIAELMNSNERMEKIKQYVIDRHGIYTRMTEYTAVFACSSIDSLCKYYEMFRADEQRQKMGLKIAAVFSFGANDEFKDDDGSGNARQNSERLDEYVKDYNKTFGTSFKLREQFGFDRYNRDVSKRVKSGNIDILFVVNMYLTGFDSKKLNTLYVDKNLRHHGLIQAFSRTNRVQTNRKPFGNIVCFRNIKNEVDDAVALFSNKAPNESVFLPDYSVLLEQFRAALQRLREVTPTVQSVDSLKGMKAKEEFIKAFRSVLRKHNVLSNDTDFKFDDVDISEQELADYGSKYRDLQPSVKLYKEEAVKESILGEIDFEIELLGTTKVDVDYILELLGKMVGSDVESKEKLKEKLLQQITNDIKQHSKRELIQRFIEEQLVHIDNPMSIADALEDFFADEREKALFKLSTEYAVQPEQLSEVIDKYVWLGQEVPKDKMTELLKGKYSYFQLSKLSANLSEAVNEYTETYYTGW